MSKNEKVVESERTEFVEFFETVKNMYIKNKDLYWKEIQHRIGVIISSST